MMPLQRLTEALIELLLYKAKEGGGEGRLLEGLLPQPWADPGCLLQEEEHLVSGGVDPISPRNKVQNMAQASIWDSTLSQPTMGATFCLPISRLVSAKEVRVLPPISLPTSA